MRQAAGILVCCAAPGPDGKAKTGESNFQIGVSVTCSQRTITACGEAKFVLILAGRAFDKQRQCAAGHSGRARIPPANESLVFAIAIQIKHIGDGVDRAATRVDQSAIGIELEPGREKILNSRGIRRG